MDSFISLLLKILMLFMAFIMMICFILFGIELSDISNYKQYVNYTIERNGGLTSEAVREIEEYSEKHVHGRYEVSSEKMGQKVKYGEKVLYQVKCKYYLYGILPKEVVFDVKGEAVSQVRQ